MDYERQCRDKVKYMTKRAAKKSRVMQTGQGIHGLSVYRCEHCNAYHLGHVPQRVKNGTVSRDLWERSQ